MIESLILNLSGHQTHHQPKGGWLLSSEIVFWDTKKAFTLNSKKKKKKIYFFGGFLVADRIKVTPEFAINFCLTTILTCI